MMELLKTCFGEAKFKLIEEMLNDEMLKWLKSNILYDENGDYVISITVNQLFYVYVRDSLNNDDERRKYLLILKDNFIEYLITNVCFIKQCCLLEVLDIDFINRIFKLPSKMYINTLMRHYRQHEDYITGLLMLTKLSS